MLRATRFCWATEADLQQAMSAAFASRGLAFRREVRLDAHNRIDFLLGRVGIEVKVAGVWRDVLRQVRRYCGSPQVDAVVVVTCKVSHARIAAVVAGKPVAVHLIGSVL